MIRAVNICGVTHTVDYKEDNFNVDTHFGQIDYGKCQILINKNLPTPMAKLTLWHEIVHGILTNYGYHDLSNDEQFVQSMAIALNMVADVRDLAPQGCEAEERKTF